jgi:short-subunit dehydrogenase
MWRMAATGRGGIVLFGLRVGLRGVPWAAAHAAIAGCVQSFAAAPAVDLRGLGVGIPSVRPGFRSKRLG